MKNPPQSNKNAAKPRNSAPRSPATTAEASPAPQKRSSGVLLPVGIAALVGAGLWGVWRGTQAITPAAFQSAVADAGAGAKPAAPVAKDPKGAADAFAAARAQEKRIVGPWIPSQEMLAFARKAVELDPTQPPYFVYLMQIYVSQRKSQQAIETGRKLLVLSPEHPWGNVMLANQLLENGAGEKDFPQIEAMLTIAERDSNLAPGFHYGRGLLALRRRQAALAVSELKQACALDPNSSVGYYDLFLAEKMAGNTAGAAKAMAEHNRCVARNTADLRKNDMAHSTAKK